MNCHGGILSDYISAYRKLHSCETSLLRLTEEWRAMRDEFGQCASQRGMRGVTTSHASQDGESTCRSHSY